MHRRWHRVRAPYAIKAEIAVAWGHPVVQERAQLGSRVGAPDGIPQIQA
jgi:hypothetical protein